MSLETLISRIGEKKSRYDALKPFPQVMEESFSNALRIEFTYHSNAIEGNTLTLAETALVVNEKVNISWKTLREIYEARNHYRAILFIESLVKAGKPLSEKEILEMHGYLLGGIDDAYAWRYRDIPVRISGSMKILPNPQKVPSLMHDFSDSLVEKPDDILEFSARKKYEFVAIHPFIDGNGRMSRLIWNYFLLREGYPLVSIDIHDRLRYIESLQEMDAWKTDKYFTLLFSSIEKSLDTFLRNAWYEPL